MRLALGLLAKISAKKLSLTGISLLFLLSACDEKLPEPSSKGANILACKVNGKSWIPDVTRSFSGKKLTLTHTYLFKPKRMFVLHATRITKKENTSIQIGLEDVRSTGKQYFAFDSNPMDVHFSNFASYSKYKPS